MRTKRKPTNHLGEKGRLKMKSIKSIINLHLKNGLSVRQISRALSLPRSTIADYLHRYKSSDLNPKDMPNLDDGSIYNRLFPGETKVIRTKKEMPDFATTHQELKRKGVTRLLLWEEYREENPEGYGYSQFCELYKQWNNKVTVSMRQVHKAGEKMFVDYSGLTMDIINSNTGEVTQAEIFVACLGASGYSYAEAGMSQKKASFINSHINAFNFFGGVTAILVPDNLKSAVIRYDRYEPKLNESYRDMADYYGTVIIPTRPYKPKDKAKVELSVKLVQRWILAKLRNRQFFDIHELNQAIRPLLTELNNRKIRLLGKSRRELYEELDKPALKPLPPEKYHYHEFKLCRVNIDYHIQLEKCYYSVPYRLAGKEVEVRYSDFTVEITHQNKQVAIHNRLHHPGAYSTIKEHMASAHRAYAEWTPSRMISWSKSFGINTQVLIETLLTKKPHPEMGFRSCLGILNSAKGVDTDIVEAVSKKMLTLNVYRVSSFRSILKNKTYKKEKPTLAITPINNHENVRGEEYYTDGETHA
ncbi:MAG: IS21 family transposase [Candidatus Zixiibacteriota bacterium]